MARVALERWQAEFVRVTCFYGVGRPMPTKVWEVLTTIAPETRNELLAAQAVTEQGPFRDGRLICSTTPGRMDVVYHGVATGGFPSLGSVQSAQSALVDLISEHVEFFTHASRVAFGMTATIPVSAREDGYRILGELLSGVTVDVESRDLFYQINRPRESRLMPGTEINRLSKWSAAQITQFSTSTGASSALPIFGVRCEVDLSTAPEVLLQLNTQDLRGLLDEFTALSREMFEEGDIK
ncbi:hypothetical protein [Paraburkholderia megapolitana]|uniref:TIGR04255 family protein n=1 Tax=Paraburkholderia megapolitana TaxID=420953 RepID=A0A1I3MJL8_9BURK|nr:hypothetical protein [Paraburkholderia megapolitana]QDQ84046.1 hypothetical protein FNZ07_23230 [Paraburkholderia megapolitana]SFI97344.1 hypothetical protein SAMN05192543_1056 [Paraburkholderia megapolitana]